MRVRDAYSSNVVHIPLSCVFREAAQQMRQKHAGALVVTENTPSGPRAIGVITDCNIMLDATTVGVNPSQICVADVMSRGILNTPFDAGLSDTLQEMLSSGVWRVDVASDGALIGALPPDGVLGAMATELGLIARPVHNERERETTGSVQPPLSV